MDTHTLVVMNVLLYVLYAGVIVVNARITGISKGAAWFAGSNLSRGGALLLLAARGQQSGPLQMSVAVGYLVSVSGVMMLHFSFTELLERGPLLRWLQYLLLGTMAIGTLYLMLTPSMHPLGLLVMCAVEGVQIIATASVVFLFSGEEIGLAAWLTGVALSLYAALLLMRVAVFLRFDVADYPTLARDVRRFWLEGSLVTNSAIAFGFMFLSAAKQRVELLWHAQADELTGLLNRWALTRIALRELSRRGRTKTVVSMVMMDLDGLKGLNDSLGHGCGDVVLQAVAGALGETVRDQDSVARIGGDEFCILLPDTGLVEAAVVAERIRLRVDELSVSYRGEMVRVNASLGVASSEACGLSLQCLMEKSDAALYRAKRGGKNQVAIAEQLEVLGEG
jgi:diguanylate cyclase (GGDEF)-like protein